MLRRPYLAYCSLLVAVTLGAILRAQDNGAALFAQHCAACHTLTSDAIGPPLGGITSVLSENELLEFIRNPLGVIDSGDARANALLQRYKVAMPSFAHLEAEQITAVIGYIREQSTERNLAPFVVDTNSSSTNSERFVAPIEKSGLVIELEDIVQIPRLPNRPAYKGIAFLRPDPREDGTLFVSELMGILYRVKNGEVNPFLDVREYFEYFVFEPGVATGLGSFALHPEFNDNGIFYTTHAELNRGSPAINADDIPADVPDNGSPSLEWTLSEWKLSDIEATEFAGTHREILRFVTPTTAHGSQEIDFAPITDPSNPDYGMLYLTCGDGGSINLKRPDMAGHPRTLLGSIMRIDPAGHNSPNGQYGIPADNPFASSNDPGVHPEIWAYGFRNPHRFSWDGKRMIAVDIGESNIEEINIIKPGGSYGWGVASIEGTTRIDVQTDAKVVFAATASELANVRLPHGQYDHADGQAITGGFVYRGPIATLQGKYIFGDIVNGRILYMNMNADLTDHTIYEMHVVRDGAATTIKELSQVDRAHLRFAYDDSNGDLFILTKDDGMVRRITMAYYATE